MGRRLRHESGAVRVVQIIRDETYGQLRHAQNLAALPGVDSIVVGPGAAAERLPGARVVVSDIPRRPSVRTVSEARRLSALLRPLHPDVVHSHSIATLLPGMLVARSLGVPFVHSPHALPVAGLSGSRAEVAVARGLVGLAAARGSRFIAVSHGEFAQMRHLAAAGRARVDVVLNPVPERFLAPWPAARPGNVVLSLSRFWPQKDPALTVRAFALLRQEVPDACLRWAGDGPLLEETRALAHELGLGGAIEFLGPVPDPLALLHEASVLVSSSQFEAMPYSILEGMATGTVVAATDIAAHREIDGGTGALALVEAKPERLAHCMADLLLDPESRTTQQAAARRRVEDAYSVARFGAAMEAIYSAIAFPARAAVPFGSAHEVPR